MECKRLQGLVKSWYAQVQDESMAPARMVSFMEKHIAECAFCLADPLVRQDVVKITAILLPPTKVRKPSADEEGALVEDLEKEDHALAGEEMPEDDEAGIEEEETDDETEALEDEELEEDEEDDL
jgi:hypothetical protein